MARITTTSQKKKITIPGMVYPATDLALVATDASYPGAFDLFRKVAAKPVLHWVSAREDVALGRL